MKPMPLVILLAGTLAAQGMSSPSYDNECVVVLTAVEHHASAGFQSLTAVGGVSGPEQTSALFSLTFDPLCLAGGCATTLCGDCNLDGTLNILDSLTAAQHAVATISLSGAAFDNCDADTNGNVDILDALLLAQAAAGLPVTPSCC